MRSMVEGCPPLDRVTPLRQACGLPPPLAGEEWKGWERLDMTRTG